MIVTQDLVNNSILSSPGERNGKFSQNGKFGQNGKLGHSCTNVTKGKLYGSRDSDHMHACYCAFRFKCQQLRP